jgi:hypothetical protein
MGAVDAAGSIISFAFTAALIYCALWFALLVFFVIISSFRGFVRGFARSF